MARDARDGLVAHHRHRDDRAIPLSAKAVDHARNRLRVIQAGQQACLTRGNRHGNHPGATADGA
jgi:hypothetical protein